MTTCEEPSFTALTTSIEEQESFEGTVFLNGKGTGTIPSLLPLLFLYSITFPNRLLSFFAICTEIFLPPIKRPRRRLIAFFASHSVL